MIGERDIETLFESQLGSMRDATLRGKVVRTWVIGCERGGWKSVDELLRMPFTLLTNTRGINLIEHTLAVTAGAIGLARAMQDHYGQMPLKIDFDRLVAAGLVHDVGKLLEFEPDGAGGYRKSRMGLCARHPISGVILAELAGLPPELVNTIACHAKEGEGRPQTVETVLVHQADFATFNPLVMLQNGTLIE